MLFASILLQMFILIGTLFVVQVVWHVPVFEQIAASWTTLLILFGYNLILGPLGEELGWSGFVLNELQKRFSPIKAALIVGVTWECWHASLWLMSGYMGMDLLLYIVCFMVSIIVVSIMITVFYNLNHNLVIPILIHQLFNYLLAIQLGDRLPILLVRSVLYLIVAVGLVLVNDKKCLYK
ncbi:CPBP family intramembrane glutamic endopeptidase [Paenibacillus sp. 481]|uniref:CPBP family intramembrane glutamic endopeptidase n=1 Tax=Paenibacillus sp. 481 TaxID=2835869 RepID=UPI001E636119|nr:CPBP family intramembrane glutamic endopeptidase [Paenibacillus sp. 481]